MIGGNLGWVRENLGFVQTETLEFGRRNSRVWSEETLGFGRRKPRVWSEESLNLVGGYLGVA